MLLVLVVDVAIVNLFAAKYGTKCYNKWAKKH